MFKFSHQQLPDKVFVSTDSKKSEPPHKTKHVLIRKPQSDD